VRCVGRFAFTSLSVHSLSFHVLRYLLMVSAGLGHTLCTAARGDSGKAGTHASPAGKPLAGLIVLELSREGPTIRPRDAEPSCLRTSRQFPTRESLKPGATKNSLHTLYGLQGNPCDPPSLIQHHHPLQGRRSGNKQPGAEVTALGSSI